jgi:hypothetical protein
VALPDPDGPSLVDPALLREHRPQEVMFVPFPVPIALDGDLGDWNGIPFEIVDTGPMVSLDPAENGHFQFALAADETHLYLYMVMPDATIVTGQHGTDFWNEDSLEFYLNFTDDLFRRDYGDGVFQVNVNPTNLGNTDPTDLVITGRQRRPALRRARLRVRDRRRLGLRGRRPDPRRASSCGTASRSACRRTPTARPAARATSS